MLLLGDYVTATIVGHKLNNVYRIHNNYIHDYNTIWLYDNGILRVKKIEVLFSDQDFSYTNSTIGENQLLITSHIALPKDGAKIFLNKT